MMIRIAVCEDEEAQAEYLKTLLDRWQELARVSAAVDVYHSAEQFLFEAEAQKTYDIMLLDIQMGEMNGLDLARRVRERDKRVRIVFLTGVAEYAIEGYEVGALRYLLKPVKEPVFFEMLSSLSEEMRREEPEYFMFEANGMYNRVLLGDILYAEADGHYVVLKTETGAGKRRWKANFSAVSEKLLEKGFFLLRRGLCVNISRLIRIGKTECELENGEILPVSKGNYQALNEAFIAYYKGRAE